MRAVKTVQEVGRYELLRVVGRGGMATVFLARQTDLDRLVALKQLAVFEGSGPGPAQRFLREARLAGSMSHPNLVTVHEFFEDDDVPYIAMEYLARGSLRPYVGRLRQAQAGGVLHGMLSGLALAERLGVVHRDIKPENVMVTEQGSVKVADFGIAKATSEAAATARLTTTGTTLGTPRYMAPERAMGEDVGPWSDLYSVGVMAFELLVGRPPFHDTEEPAAILLRNINDPVPPVHTLRPEIDPALSDWIERLLIKDPAKRTRSAAVACAELEAVLDDALGARWQRDAPLGAEPQAPISERVTRTRPLLPQETHGATIAPETQPLQGRSATPRARRPGHVAPAAVRRRRERLVTAALALTATVLAAAALKSGGGGTEPGATSHGRATPAATAPSGVMTALRASARSDGAALRAATTADAKREALRSLAADYDQAARTLEGRGAGARLVAVLDEASAAYTRAADAVAEPPSQAEAAIGTAERSGAAALGEPQPDSSGVGDSRSDDPSDDEPDEDDNGD
jgi:hypothetical protein